MEELKLSELKSKSVVSTRSGKNLGQVIDACIEPEGGRVVSVTVVKKTGLLGLFGGEESVFSWSDIRLVGEDAVLVDGDARRPDGKTDKNGGFSFFDKNLP
ncbi:MAG: YlmC/YmxH family sporulation protein [Clostridiales bacterium]|nr:YlmC/YmxH family sporulation protein [Clostridiales bacterium]